MVKIQRMSDYKVIRLQLCYGKVFEKKGSYKKLFAQSSLAVLSIDASKSAESSSLAVFIALSSQSDMMPRASRFGAPTFFEQAHSHS
ncbi:MAG: hypothetical protein SFV17_04095 [Candidatus Obscuribacter sp.]|nr:hypothetical protein [Candidatus Obscuribacter sp.]